MACFAVAVAGAQVTEEHLCTYLTPSTITAPLTAYLKAKWPIAKIYQATYGDDATWTITLAGQDYTISVCNGQITSRNYQQNTQAAQELADEVRQALTAISVAYWQNDTYQFLAAQYTVTESQRTADGNLVVRLRV